jgi:hypothetical protein
MNSNDLQGVHWAKSSMCRARVPSLWGSVKLYFHLNFPRVIGKLIPRII